MRRLYFVAIIPDQQIQDEVRAFKEYAAKHFESSRALRSPAHITIFPPFWYEEPDILKIHDMLSELALSTPPFLVKLDGFRAFKPRVVFVNPVPSKDAETLSERVEESLGPLVPEHKPSKRPFHAHMTIAFKDLSKPMFWKAWDHFKEKEYRRVFKVNNICLLKHESKQWRVEEEFQFHD